MAATTYMSDDGIGSAGHSVNGTGVTATREGEIWFSNTWGCGPFDGRRFQSVEPNAGYFVHLSPHGKAGVWAIRDRFLVRYEPGKAVGDVVADLGGLSVHTLFEDSEGTLWIGSNDGGLIRFKAGEFTRIPFEGSVLCLFEDDEGNLWGGGSSTGVTRLHRRDFTWRKKEEGLRDEEVYSVGQDEAGRIWLAGRNRMLVHGVDGLNRRFESPQGWTTGASKRCRSSLRSKSHECSVYESFWGLFP